MARKRAMSAREVEALREIGMTCVSDNLYLQIREQGTRSWLFRYWRDRKPKVVGLGATKDVMLTQARDKAERLRVAVRDGADPADEKKAKRTARKAAVATVAAAWPDAEIQGRWI